MNVEVREVANGWMVLPSQWGREHLMTNSSEVRVFNSFNDLTAYLKSLSKIEQGK